MIDKKYFFFLFIEGWHKTTTINKAKEYCQGEGGRLCTKDELKSSCAIGSGCPVDRQLVWSALEAEPDCPATSFNSCMEFAMAFDKLYEHSPRNTT